MLDEKKRNSTGSPVIRPNSRSGRGMSLPSSIPWGTTQIALSGGVKPGTAGMVDSRPM